ncbi:MAG: acetylxylan esterase [Lentisphaeria bacterium]|nr:acetylxylan esterase [Lentisphaeria bacterium]
MFMRKMIGCCAVLAALAAAGNDALSIAARAERESALYAPGETVTFQIAVSDADGKPVSGVELPYTLTGDGGLSLKGKIVPKDGRAEVSVKPERHGFVLLSIRPPANGARRRPGPVCAGAGVAVEKIRPGTPECPDFDRFWQKEAAAVRQAKFECSLTEVQQKDSRVKAFDVKLSDGTFTTRGYLALPAKTTPAGHPILMMFNGAGTIGANFKSAIQRAHRYNCIVFNMSIHDVPNGLPPAEQAKLRKSPEIFQYMYRGVDSPETYPIREIFRRVVCAVEYMKSRPEWDGKRIVMQGGSLGGAQAIFGAYIEPRTVLCIANAPALSDHFGGDLMQAAGWPDMFRSLAKKKLDPAAARRTMGYFDTVNFAKKLPCPIRLSVGFIDTICPPTSVYALYNSIPGEKSIVNVVTGAHGPVADRREKSVFVQNMRYMDELLLPKKTRRGGEK